MKKTIGVLLFCLCMCFFAGCSSGSETSAQSRMDLTADHIRGLSANMDRKDVEDLLGQDDDNLAQKEDIDIYSLSDGNTAVLRYVDDKLASVYLRGKDMYEDTIFSKFAKDIKEDFDAGDGSYNTEDGKVDDGSNQNSGTDSSDSMTTDPNKQSDENSLQSNDNSSQSGEDSSIIDDSTSQSNSMGDSMGE